MSNLPTVQNLYEAFGRGDIPTILDQIADDIDWEYDNADSGVPILTPGRGKETVLRYFEALGSGVEISAFEPLTFMESGDLVVAVCRLEAVVKDTGKSIQQEHEIHLWTFGEGGSITRFCHKADTHSYWLAYQQD